MPKGKSLNGWRRLYIVLWIFYMVVVTGFYVRYLGGDLTYYYSDWSVIAELKGNIREEAGYSVDISEYMPGVSIVFRLGDQDHTFRIPSEKFDDAAVRIPRIYREISYAHHQRASTPFYRHEDFPLSTAIWFLSLLVPPAVVYAIIFVLVRTVKWVSEGFRQ